jgi:uncharacterized membrane protein (DUF373 family)
MPHHRRHVPHSEDPKVLAYYERLNKRADMEDHIFRRTLHILERFIAVITIIGLLAALGLIIYEMLTVEGYFRDVNNVLHHLLSLVVGVEFVRMLIDTTPSNILEVLTVAITRHVILAHDNPWANVASILCIAALFATRRFLIRRSELKEELVEIE